MSYKPALRGRKWTETRGGMGEMITMMKKMLMTMTTMKNSDGEKSCETNATLKWTQRLVDSRRVTIIGKKTTNEAERHSRSSPRESRENIENDSNAFDEEERKRRRNTNHRKRRRHRHRHRDWAKTSIKQRKDNTKR